MDIARPLRPTPGQRALADQLARGEAALGQRIETLPANVYIDQDRFEAEQRAIFDRLPHLIGPSALLGEPAQAVAHDGYGSPLILTRDADGKAHAFANVCRHRGTRLIDSQEQLALEQRAFERRYSGVLTLCWMTSAREKSRNHIHSP